jgi:transposase
MSRTRPPYPLEFRCEAVQLVRGGRSVKDVAESLGCSEQSLHNWVKQHQLDSRERDDGLTSAEREELRELRKRVKRVEQERDILKRAAAISMRQRNAASSVAAGV